MLTHNVFAREFLFVFTLLSVSKQNNSSELLLVFLSFTLIFKTYHWANLASLFV